MIRVGERTSKVASATLEVFHLFAVEAGWVLEAALDDGTQIALEGRVRTPVLPGPSRLDLWYVDAPRVGTVEGQLGTLAACPPAPNLMCSALPGGRVRIAGTLALVWTSVVDHVVGRYEIEMDLDAAIVT